MRKTFIFISALFTVAIFSCSPKLNPVAGQQLGAADTAVTDTDNADVTAKDKTSLGNFTGVLDKDIIYANNTNRAGTPQKLGMDVYKPANAEGKKFPLVLLIHGGGFKVGSKRGMADLCGALVQSGYVAVAIDYRLGWGTGAPKGACTTDTTELKEAIYRASQDAHAALRYLVAHADEYSIDKNWIFIGGSSAGAVSALATAYLSQKDADIFMPGFSSKLGELNKGGNDIKDSYTFRGVISMWGAFLDPALITESTALPTIFFQGEKDKAVPFNTGHLTPCPATSTAYGTYPLYNRLKELGVTTVAHVDPNGGHGVFSFQFRVANIICFLNNVRAGNKKQVYLEGEQSSCN